MELTMQMQEDATALVNQAAEMKLAVWEDHVSKIARTQPPAVLWDVCGRIGPLYARPILAQLEQANWQPAHNQALYTAIQAARVATRNQTIPAAWVIRATVNAYDDTSENQMHFMADGERLVVCIGAERLFIVSAGDAHPLASFELGLIVGSVVPSHRANQIWVSWRDKNVVTRYSVLNPSGVPEIVLENEFPVTSHAISSDDRIAYHGDETGFLRVWNIDQRRVVASRYLRSAPVSAMTTSRNGQWLAGGVRGAVWVWSLPKLRKIVRIDLDKESEPSRIEFSADFRHLIISTSKNDYVVEFPSGKLVLKERYTSGGTTIPKSDLMFFASAPGWVRNPFAGIRAYRFDGTPLDEYIPCRDLYVAVHPSGQWVATAPQTTGIINIWERSALYNLLNTPVAHWPSRTLQAATQEVTGRQTHVADMPYADRVTWLAYCRAFASLQRRYDISLDEDDRPAIRSLDIGIADA